MDHAEDFPAYIPIDPCSPDPDFRPGAVWSAARAAYLAGESAPRVCQRFDLAPSTFRTRARIEGWRRCDQEAAAAEPRDLDPAPPTPEMVDEAWRAVADALRRGRAYEARTFLRLVHELREEVRRDERLAQIAAAKAAADTTDPELHHLHSESKGAASEPTDPNAEPVAKPSEPPSLAETQADIAEMEAEYAALTAKARAGRAAKEELVALRAMRQFIRDRKRGLKALYPENEPYSGPL